jgi:isoquinoline 1-oxidoreductase
MKDLEWDGEVGSLDRRQFIKLVGGGIMVFFAVDGSTVLGQRRDYPKDLNAYLLIGEDGRITCYSGKIEMGQGIITSLAQMLAEELDVPLGSVDMVMGDTALCPWDSSTTGSRSTKYFGPALRRASAEARAVLVQLAAEHLGTSPESLQTKDGAVFDGRDPSKKVTYAELAGGKKIERQLEVEASPKAVSEHTVSGKATPRTDSLQKVTGEGQFTGDIRLPGMLYAKLVRPPAHRAKLESVDTTAAERIEGAKVIRDGDLVAVLHEQPDVAEKAVWQIKAKWTSPESEVDHNTIFEHLTSKAGSRDNVTEKGSLEQGKTLSAKTFDTTYFNHYVAHAPMETHTAVVNIEGDKATVWASTQSPFRAQGSVAETLGIPPENVRVITPFVGGGFGGKTWIGQVHEAARLAKLSERPVMVSWSRKEEFFYDSFRPAAVIRLKSGIDAENRIVYWDYDNFFAGTRSSEPVYDIPHHRISSRGGWGGGEQPHPFAVGAWRGPGSNTNVFAMESQIDIMAEAAGIDPLAFRQKNLKDDRMKKVLEAAAETFGQPFAPAPSGRGYGLACTDYLGTYVATIAEVKVDKAGQARVERVVCAQDTGEVINPEGIRLQIESCVTMGLGYCLTEEIRFNGGEIFDENFDTYEIPRFSWLPKIESVIVDNPEMAPQGCGEPAVTTMGAVIANAIYDAIGRRLVTLPMTPERIQEAMENG